MEGEASGVKEIAAILLALGCNPEARVVLDPHLEVPGYYRDGTLYIRPDSPKSVWLHECRHTRQPVATNAREWDLNEREARMAELRAREE